MRRILLLATFMLTTLVGVFAQGVTTSTLSGTVKGNDGSPVPGANVVATHEPSGTTYGTVSLADGRFIIQNMRTGGPYKVKISFIGYSEQTYGDIYLRLGEVYTIAPVLTEEATTLGEIVVSAGPEDKLMNSTRNGAVTNISTTQLQGMPSITRSINDMTRMTPQATSTSNGAIGGGNYRQNYITIDGSDFNNNFGIGGNLPAGGSPISLDALEEISVNVTPYDIRQSGFVGSAINAVTRAGTNEFSGSAYTFWRNQNQQGNKVGYNDEFDRQPFEESTFGFRLGGPILKNKLFFFINAEKITATRPGQLNVAATPEKPFGPDNPNVSRPTADFLDEVRTYLKDTYNYETGPYQGYDFESENTRFLARVDWNINNNHRLSVRYSQVESTTPSFMNGSRSPLTQFATGLGRTNNNALWFKNSNYFQGANFYSFAIELNSNFSLFNTNFSNTFRGSWTKQDDTSKSNGDIFPFVDILDGTGGAAVLNGSATGVPITSFGYELFRFGNVRDVESYSIVDNLTFSKGIHNFTAGFQIDLQQTRNGFQRFGTSYYTYASWADFVSAADPVPANRANPVAFGMTYPLNDEFKQAFPRFAFAQYSVYAQDEMAVSDRLKVTVGLRLDLPTYLDVKEIKTHPLVAELEFKDGKIIDTGVLPETQVMFSPRVGFNWDVKGDRSLQVRGGTGIFTGRVPTVWIVSQSGDAGLLQFTQTYVGQANTPGPFNPDPRAYYPATPPQAGTAIPSTISATDPNFKFPQTWKSSLAVDSKLPGGLIGTLEFIYNKDINVAVGKNINLVDATPLNVVDNNGVAYPDNRPIYPSNNNQKYYNYLNNVGLPNVNNTNNTAGNSRFDTPVLSNDSRGYYWSITAKLDKQFDNGFAASIAYIRSQAKNVYDGNGDQLLNTWSLNQIVRNSNNPELSFANYIVPNRMVASLSYRKEFFKKVAASVAFFYEGSIQGRFSYTYSVDFNRDNQANDLIYVPKDASEITFVDRVYGSGANAVTYTAAQQSAMFFKYIEQDEYLKSRKGKYAERNGVQLPWRNQVDFRFAFDIFTNVGGKKNTLQFTWDIFNFGNFLNKNWGVFDVVNTPALLIPRNVSSLVPGGNVKPTFSLAEDRGAPVTSTYRQNNSLTSTYYQQFGLRYIFN